VSDGVQAPPIRILLVDEQSLFRDAVRTVLDSEPDMRVVGEAQEGREAAREAERLQPHVVLLTSVLLDTDGVQTTHLIKRRVPDCLVLVLGLAEDDTLKLVGALEAGATGCLPWDCPLDQLIAATRAVHRGQTVIPDRMLRPLLDELIARRRRHGDALRRVKYLTQRERLVLAHLTEGAGKDAIARALVISPETARTHIHNVLRKLAVHSRLEAAAFVLQSGIKDELTERTPA
jgi:DNA-binding NarL/FixJ family response regulator